MSWFRRDTQMEPNVNSVLESRIKALERKFKPRVTYEGDWRSYANRAAPETLRNELDALATALGFEFEEVDAVPAKTVARKVKK